MKLGVLFSGGKDSCMAAYMVKKQGHELACLITIHSKNQESYMFHTCSIKKTKDQAKVMNIPLIAVKTKGKKEKELLDLETAIKKAKKDYKIEGIVSGALASNYQKSRIEEICKRLKLNSLTPLWQKDGFEYLDDIIKNNFRVIVTAVSAYPLSASWLGREINKEFIEDLHNLYKKYKVHPAGEGGEFETFVLYCPLFERPLQVIEANFTGEKNSWQMELGLK
ncbi:MAG TPA: diphthine--ammonia ligase [Bacillota bacterium]|nr:diphthine--ammonia ligase [Bacillota bacterium]